MTPNPMYIPMVMVANANELSREQSVLIHFSILASFIVVVIEVIKALTATLLLVRSNVIAMFSIVKSLANDLPIHIDLCCHYDCDSSFAFIHG